MADSARTVVDAPEVAQWRYGLVSVATVLTGEGRWQVGGVEYQGDNCPDGGIWEGSRCNPSGETRTVVVDLEASGGGGDQPSTVTATAHVDIEPERDLTVTVGSNPAVPVTTGAGAVEVGQVEVNHRELRVEFVADTQGGVTASATVRGGPARAVTVTVDSGDAVTLTTGEEAKVVGTIATDGEWHLVEAKDVESQLSGSGEIATDGTAPHTTTVTITVPVETPVPVTVTDTATGRSRSATLTLNSSGDGSTSVALAVQESLAKTIPDGLGTTESGDPFAVYSGVSCNAVGLDDPIGRARRRLELVEQRLVERRFWNRQLATSDAVDVTPTAGQAVDLVTGIGLLEQALAGRYGGIGTIHAPRRVAAHADDHQLIHPDRAMLRTVLGTMLAFGGGYPGTGPNGTEPADPKHVWLYATGQVVIRRGLIHVPAGPNSGAYDPPTNKVLVLAERTYVITRDCDAFAVLVDLGAPS